MDRAVLLLVCPDAPGILADVATWVAQSGGSIVDAAQTSDIDHGLFIQRVEFDHTEDVEELRRSFRDLAVRWAMWWELQVPKEKARLSILVTKEAHCLYDLLGRCASGDLPAFVVSVISNRSDLEEAAGRFGVPFHHLPVDADDPDARLAQENEVNAVLEADQPDLVILARYMRVLTPQFTERWSERTINIHHSFLPAFIGANAYRQAWERGVKLIGATAHYVTSGLDEGPIITQDVARVAPGDTPVTMARRGRDLESLVLSTAVRAHLEHRVIAYSGRTVVFD